MIKVEKILYEDDKYQSNTEQTLYIGENIKDAVKIFESFIETNIETVIISEYIKDENRWELIKEK